MNKVIRSGDLDRRITIEYPVETNTATGARSVVWAAWKSNIPAQKVYASKGKEDFSDAKPISESDVSFITRYLLSDSTPIVPNAKMRITDIVTEEVFDVRYVSEIGRRVGWQMDCKHRK